jgi:YVTN family beta-propeller protein
MIGAAFRLGVDFGTSNTVAALAGSDGRVQPLLFDGSPLLPSAVFAGNGTGLLSGWDAVRAAFNGDPSGLALYPKRWIDEGAVRLGDQEYPVAELIATVLGRVAMEAARVAGRGVELQAVLTHPASWTRARLDVLADAAARAGLGAVQFVCEPIAAAAYLATVVDREPYADRCVVVCDLGAGTFDVSVVRSLAGRFTVAAAGELADVGGIALDAVVVRQARRMTAGAEQLWQRLDWPQTLAEYQALQTLWQAARVAKEQLSGHDAADLYLPIAERILPVTREEFETAARPYLEPPAALTAQVLAQAQVALDEIGGVFLVGGASRTPSAAALLHRALHLAPTIVDQPELVMAEGALYDGSAALAPDPLGPAVRSVGRSAEAVRLVTATFRTPAAAPPERAAAPATTAPPEWPAAAPAAAPAATAPPEWPAAAPVSAAPPAPVSAAPAAAPVSAAPAAAAPVTPSGSSAAAPTGARPRRWRLAVAAAVALTVLVGGGVASAAVLRNQPGATPGRLAGLPAVVSSQAPLGEPEATPEAPPAGPVSVDRPVVWATINVGTEPEGVAVSPDSRTVYVANQHSHVLSVIDVDSRNVTPVGLVHTPRFVAVSRNGARVFVSMYEDDFSGSGVAIVDAATRSVRYVSTGPQPYALSVAPDGRLWVPIHSQHRIEVYNPDSGARVATVDVPPNAHSVDFSPALGRAFTPDHESNLVSVIDMRTNRSSGIPVDTAPHSLALSPDQRTIIVACYGANVVDFIDPVSLRNTGRLPVGVKPRYVAFATDGRHAYVVNEGSDSVSVINVATRKVSSVIRVGHSPRTIGLAPDGRFAYASNGRDNTVSVIDLTR